jgi:acyl carrier protein
MPSGSRPRSRSFLAADSLELVEIALAIEGNLGLTLPHQFLDRVRTCGDLVDETLAVVRRGRRRRPGPSSA